MLLLTPRKNPKQPRKARILLQPILSAIFYAAEMQSSVLRVEGVLELERSIILLPSPQTFSWFTHRRRRWLGIGVPTQGYKLLTKEDKLLTIEEFN